MKRVLLATVGKIAFIPYINLYLDNVDAQFDLVYWDRDGKGDMPVPDKINKAYKYEGHFEEGISVKQKLPHFIAYRRLAMNVIKKNHYDKIVILHTIPGLLLYDYLLLHYSGKYVLDIRDLTHENKKIVGGMIGKLVTHAGLVLVSSDAFREFLPKVGIIHTVHNYNKQDLEKAKYTKHYSGKTIRLNYWGLVRHAEVNSAMLMRLGNDERFEISYFGRLQKDGRTIQQYVEDHQLENVKLHGTYMPPERYEFIQNTDLIHNIYRVDFTMGHAVPNKYYDGIIFKIPQLCAKGSYIGRLVEEKKLGLAVDVNTNDLADQIYQYYSTLDWQEFEIACQRELSRVIEEQKNTILIINEFLNSHSL